ncbi:MAG: glycosyltransferase family 39 protein [Acidobacteriaceae bacterium]|nr:glycosyltransferase family 39 protein [Acidobacteriaceae bacterium]
MEATTTARRHQRTLPRLTLLATWLLLYASFTLFSPPLMDDADSVHAEVAREMVLRHDWVTLYANGIRYLEKAPVLYWSMAASFKLFGPYDWAARLPLALGMLALIFAVYNFGRRAFSERAGFYAAMILATTAGCFLYTRFIIPDVLVCLWITLSLYAFWQAEQSDLPSRWHCALFAACCALNVLTKGLIGIVFPVGIALAYLLLTRGVRGAAARCRQFHPALAAAIFLIIAAPWHILAGLHNPTQGHIAGIGFTHWPWTIPQPTPGNVHGWFWFYFLNEHLLRYLNLRVPRDYDTVPLWLFWGLLFVWLMPWSAWLIAHVFQSIKISVLPTEAQRSGGTRFTLSSWRESLRHNPARRTTLLLALSAATVMLFFSFSTRQEYYALPALPALALLIANWLAQEDSSPALARTGKRISLGILVVGILGTIAAAGFVLLTKAPGPQADLASLLAQNPADYALSLGHFLDLNAQALGLFRLPLTLTALALAAGAIGNFIARRRNRPAAGNAFLFGMMIVFLIAVQLAFTTFNTVLGSKNLADAITAQQPTAQDLIAIHGEYENGSTLGFYLRRSDIHIVSGRSSNLWYGSFFPDAPKIFEDPESLAAKWSGPQRIFMWNDPSDATRPLPPLQPIYVVAKSGGKQILSNQPAR